ncbi:MAG: nuclear transport factor 2 family protein [Limnohabitans sp.]
MNRFFIPSLYMAFICSGSVLSVSAADCEPIRAEEVLQAEQSRLDSQMQNNLENMQLLLDDDLVYVRNSAVVDSKASYLDSMRIGQTIYDLIEHSNDAVRVHGCVAILTGLGKYDVRISQKPLNLKLRYHSIWHKSHGKVKLVSWHATKVP